MIRNLFKREKSSLEVGSGSAGLYFERWGGMEAAHRASTFLALVLFVLVIGQQIMIGRLVQQPPTVIAVDSAGAARVIRPAEFLAQVSMPEILAFVRRFELAFNELGAYTYERNLTEASAMMTPEFKEKANRLFQEQGTLESLKKDAVRTRLTIVTVECPEEKETGSHIECTATGNKTVGSYADDSPEEKALFEHTLILRKVARSEAAPNALLVEDWHERLFSR